jgi:hypothetical protein
MPEELTNPWPDFQLTGTEPSSPKEVIRRVGVGLKAKTNGLVEWYPMTTQVVSDNVEVTFSFLARILTYQFPFLKAKFPISTMYPVELVIDKLPGTQIAQDERSLVELLTKAFNAETTKTTVLQLMALSR